MAVKERCPRKSMTNLSFDTLVIIAQLSASLVVASLGLFLGYTFWRLMK